VVRIDSGRELNGGNPASVEDRCGRRRFLRAAAICLAAAAVDPLTLCTTALARRHRPRPATAASEEGEGAAPKPGLIAPYSAACVMEPTTGSVIFDQKMHKPWPTASLAKMMLMLIVAEKIRDGSLKLADTVTASHLAAKMGGSQVYLKEGETFSLDDMMKAVVVHSANDASVAVAEYVGGSTDAFVVMMNQAAAKLELKDTRYYSVHGLPSGPGQQTDVSSAYDLAVIARELVKYPDVLRWASIDMTGFRGGTFQLRNTNHLVRTYPGCDGLKTGFYYAAGFNIVATAHRGGLRLIAVVLGSPGKNQNFEQAAVLMSQGFARYEMRQVAKQGAAVSHSLAIKGGTISSLKPVWGTDASIFVKRGAEKGAYKIDFRLPASIRAPVRTGQQVGTGGILVAGKLQQEIPLLAPADVGEGSWWRRLMGKV
jgi:D-alanyl-D-alanine carboxypeptidase (penicillin-binding protein 5/6)